MNAELHQKLAISVKRTKRNFIIVEFILASLVLMILAGIFTDKEATLLIQIALGIFGCGVLFLMVKMGQIISKPNPLIEIIEHHPSQIKTVEVISIVYQTGRATYQMSLHFLTEDGKRHVLSENRSSIEAMLPLLKVQLPHAEFKEAKQR